MQPNLQSFNIFGVSHPLAHCTPVPGTMGQLFRHENFIILKVVREIDMTVCRNSKYPPSFVTSRLNRILVYAVALIKQCLIQKITASSHLGRVDLVLKYKEHFASSF